jgi:hypothetical protein
MDETNEPDLDELEFVDKYPDPGDVDEIDRNVIIRSIGDIFPVGFSSVGKTGPNSQPAVARQCIFIRLCKHYLWDSQNNDGIHSESQSRQRAIEQVASEKDIDESTIYSHIYSGYQKEADSEGHALRQFEDDLKMLESQYRNLEEQC